VVSCVCVCVTKDVIQVCMCSVSVLQPIVFSIAIEISMHTRAVVTTVRVKGVSAGFLWTIHDKRDEERLVRPRWLGVDYEKANARYWTNLFVDDQV